MSILKDQAKQKVDDAAEAVKEAIDKGSDKAQELAHQAGKKMEKGESAFRRHDTF